MTINHPSDNEQQKLDWLQLFRSQNIGVATFYHLLATYGTARKALDILPELLKRTGNKKNIIIASRSDIEKEWAETKKFGAEIIASFEADYPSLLKHIPDAPPLMTIIGQKHLLHNKAIAMVGARNASAQGCRFAKLIATDLGQKGITVISGLARGIDTASHQGALESGTIAVIAGGINHIYPKENTALYHAIAEKGVIVAELPFGINPQSRHFPQRNRIISGLSLGTLIVEAALGSGSLITARMALEQNRELFAIPGPPLDPRSNGTNSLIKQGAHLTESAGDILDVINQHQYSPSQTSLFEQKSSFSIEFTSTDIIPPEIEVDKASDYVLQKLGATVIDVDMLARDAALPVPTLLVALLELELAGKIERHSGNKVSRIFMQDDIHSYQRAG